MKKIKVLFGICLILIMGAVIIQSCEEEEEPAQTLSAFVIGEWESQDLLLGDTEAHFLADIEANQYTLTLVVGEESAELQPEGYVVDNDANTITIDQPTFPGDEPSDEVVPFKVTWNEGGDVMTWLPVDPLEDDGPPTINWTRQTGI